MPTRRSFCLTLSAAACLLEAADALSQEQVAGAAPSTMAPPDAARDSALLKRNEIFRASELPVHPSANGSSQHVVQGSLLTGEGVELHNSTLLPGHEPHPPHQHVHSEFLLIREGEMEWLLDGKRQPAGPGDILYAASNVLHGLRNTGTTTARYFVLAVGPNLVSKSA